MYVTKGLLKYQEHAVLNNINTRDVSNHVESVNNYAEYLVGHFSLLMNEKLNWNLMASFV